MTVLYVDLSHHDWDRLKGEFDWAAIRKATSPVLCLRATYGDPQGYNPTTRHFADMARGAKASGFDAVGGYHNLVKGDQASINRQVDYLRRTLDGVGGTWAMLDVERYPELVNNGLWPRFDDVRQFVDRWHAVDSRVLAVYLPKWIWSGHLGSPDLRVLACPLVASDYGSNPDGSPAGVYAARGGDSGRGWTAYGNVTPSMWQYGSNIDCPGASGQTDCNAYRGTLAQLRALLTGEDEAVTQDEIEKIAAAVVNQWLGSSGPALGTAVQATYGLAQRIAARVDVDPAELAAITEASRAGVVIALADPATVTALVAALAPLLQPGVTVDQLRAVLAGVRLTPQS